MTSSVTDIYIPDLDLMNARPLDVHSWSEHPEVMTLLMIFISSLNQLQDMKALARSW